MKKPKSGCHFEFEIFHLKFSISFSSGLFSAALTNRFVGLP